MLIAQMSDLHIKSPGSLAYRVVDTAALLTSCIHHLLSLDPRPDVVLITGDLADLGLPEEYAHLKTLLSLLPMPVLMLPGNHDNREALRAAWPDGPWPATGRMHYVIEKPPMRFVCLDSSVTGQSRGCLDGADLVWLEDTLAAAPDQPTIVALHHPPFESAIAAMDAIGLEGANAFAAVVARHPQIERVLSGHLHRPVQALVGGRLAMTAPSTAHQVYFDLAPQTPASLIMEPPGYLLHSYKSGQGMISHAIVVGQFGRLHPFSENGKLIP